MKIPGSKVEITLEFDRVIVRDDSTSKIVEYKGRTFDDVLTDVQSFMYIRGFDTARRLLRFILLRIGLPDIEEFPRDDNLSEEDMDELSGILDEIDMLSDRFLSAKHKDDYKGIEDIEKVKEIVRDDEPLPDPSIWQSDEPIDLVFKFNPENLPKKSEVRSYEQPVDWDSVRFPIFDCTYENELESVKVIVLGHSRVGKKSLLASSGFGTHCVRFEQGEMEKEVGIYSRLVDYNESSFRIDSWIAKAEPSRMFFSNSSVMVLVYSVVDRTSFQGIDYWIEEASRVLLNVPPILIVANKADLRETNPTCNHIQTTEGLQMKRLIEEKLGTHQIFHPVHFIETSCKNEIGINEAVRKILMLWLENEKIVLPLID